MGKISLTVPRHLDLPPGAGTLVRMPDILLSTLNAKYVHAAFGLRYLYANLGALQARARILEFDINQRTLDVAESLLAQNPKLIGLGVYIWNAAQTTELVATLKRLHPDLIIVLGGPEVSYETESQPLTALADHVITGEADLKFAAVCGELLGVRDGAPELTLPKVIAAELPDLAKLELPYAFYDDQDLAHRVVYVEASRGCPFTCEFCLSSLDIPVRQIPLPAFLAAMQQLLDRGLRQFKFVDRTFNLNINTSRALLEFFLARHRDGNFYHFEMIPDRLPEALREVIEKFPTGSLQFEVGIQTFNPEVGRLISRKQDYPRLADNLHFLRARTGVHVHADLIVGLPGETVESFGAGFDQLIALRPQEIQVGILKRLRGTPIVRHDGEWEMVYSAHPPYEILRNRLIDFPMMQRLRRFARYWDLLGNSGNFVETTPILWREQSPFGAFLTFSDWLYAQTGRTDSIALGRLMELLFSYLTTKLNHSPTGIAESLWRDYQRGGRNDMPGFLREHLPGTPVRAVTGNRTIPKRQARHVAVG